MTEAIEATAEVIEPTNELQATYTPAIIADNLTAVEAWVDAQIEPYVGAVLDPKNEQQIKEGRTCMADLNKIKAPIEAERKRIKGLYNAPLKAFEDRVKAITAKVDDARANLKRQVDAADEAFRDARAAALREEYDNVAGAMAGVIGFEAILDRAWLNRSVGEAKACSLLADKAAEALKGYNVLLEQSLNHKDEVMKRFSETLDLALSLELEAKLNEADAKMAEFKEAQKAANMAPEEVLAKEPIEEPSERAVAAPNPINRYRLEMEFKGTQAFAQDVAATLKGIGITGATIKCLGEVA